MIQKTRTYGFSVIGVLSVLVGQNGLADISSGYVILMSPPLLVSSNPASFDFTELMDTSFSDQVLSLPVTIADVHINHDSIKAPQGVIYGGDLGVGYQGIQLDSSLNMDSLFLENNITAPLNGYNTVLVNNYTFLTGHLYYVKTSEGKYAALVKIGIYIGGIDRHTYYWIYQSGSTNKLYDESLTAIDVHTKNFVNPKGQFDVYTNTILFIMRNLPRANIRINVFDVKGRVVWSHQNISTHDAVTTMHWNVMNNRNSGMYFVNVIKGNEVIFHKYTVVK